MPEHGGAYATGLLFVVLLQRDTGDHIVEYLRHVLHFVADTLECGGEKKIVNERAVAVS